MHLIPHVLMLIAVTIAPVAAACDAAQLPLSGNVAVPSCVTQAPTDTCVFAGKALYDYIQAIPDDDSVLTIVLQSSPWRLYDAQMRILTLDDLVASIQPKLGGGVQRVELIGSWTATAPTAGTASLAERLSQALDGFPVRGEDGFLWLAEDGTRRTTRQAFTVRASSGAYFIPKGADVLAALATGWPAEVQEHIPADNHALQLSAAIGWDAFFLCPDKALERFEFSAAQGNPIAAYNAAVMRIERGGAGDRSAALALLGQAAALGDAPSRTRLAVERARR